MTNHQLRIELHQYKDPCAAGVFSGFTTRLLHRVLSGFNKGNKGSLGFG